ncbi:hypothetical protein [Pantoea sp. RRHST58]|uniref:hypothetical protein n=1 Tax=Pantoea sp. RRHST58 TaxID=3425183 RepID=UPI003DA098AB
MDIDGYIAASPCFAALRRHDDARKKSLSTAGVNDCAGFLHTLTTGFNHDALIVHGQADYPLTRRCGRVAAPDLNF